jgi:Uma2 family endonuclease
MSTVELELERRRALGLDRFDEMWAGVYWMAPHAHSDHGLLDEAIAALLRPWAKRAGLLGSGGFNLGTPTDYRVPDRGFHRTRPGSVYVETAPVVIEIVSPGDETFSKLPFYGAHGVLEVIVVLPAEREVRCYDVTSGEGVQVPVSNVLGVEMAELTRELDWPGEPSS